MQLFSDSKPPLSEEMKFIKWVVDHKLAESKRYCVLRINPLSSNDLQKLDKLTECGMKLIHILNQSTGIAGSNDFAFMEKNPIDFVNISSKEGAKK